MRPSGPATPGTGRASPAASSPARSRSTRRTSRAGGRSPRPWAGGAARGSDGGTAGRGCCASPSPRRSRCSTARGSVWPTRRGPSGSPSCSRTCCRPRAPPGCPGRDRTPGGRHGRRGRRRGVRPRPRRRGLRLRGVGGSAAAGGAGVRRPRVRGRPPFRGPRLRADELGRAPLPLGAGPRLLRRPTHPPAPDGRSGRASPPRGAAARARGVALGRGPLPPALGATGCWGAPADGRMGRVTDSGWTGADLPDLGGVRALVTGGNSGLGFHTVLELARHGASVVLAVRDEARGADAVQQVLRQVPVARLEVRALDLADLASV